MKCYGSALVLLSLASPLWPQAVDLSHTWTAADPPPPASTSTGWAPARGSSSERSCSFDRSVATPSGRKALAPDEGPAESLEQLFLRDVRGEETGWRTDLATAADAARLGLRAERAMEERERSP